MADRLRRRRGDAVNHLPERRLRRVAAGPAVAPSGGALGKVSLRGAYKRARRTAASIEADLRGALKNTDKRAGCGEAQRAAGHDADRPEQGREQLG
jgi:hypothetical protein